MNLSFINPNQFYARRNIVTSFKKESARYDLKFTRAGMEYHRNWLLKKVSCRVYWNMLAIWHSYQVEETNYIFFNFEFFTIKFTADIQNRNWNYNILKRVQELFKDIYTVVITGSWLNDGNLFLFWEEKLNHLYLF